jgi:predicted RNA binding protein YcfA (HicA-like mRNA interferase family)
MLDHAPTVRPTATAANIAKIRVRLEHGSAADKPELTEPWPNGSEYGQGCSDISRTQRDGWIEIRCTGSHRALVKGDQQRIWAYHDGVDLGSPAMARIARDYGYTVDELRKL